MLITMAFVDNFLSKKHNLGHFFCLFVFFRYLCVLKTRYIDCKMNEGTFQAFTYPEADGYGQLPLPDDRPVILVTNDDGYAAKGINCLLECIRGLARIIVCAPDSPRSGFSASFTCTQPVTLSRLSDDGEVAIYSCSGTPVDCVKLALHRLFCERKPDLILSGINHGGNESICVMYSGTMGAVFEGCVVGVPSVGFSLLDHRKEADFTTSLPFVRRIVEQVLADPVRLGIGLNVNIPACQGIKGVKVCRQADGRWEEEFHYLNGDEHDGIASFQVTGVYVNLEPQSTDTDRYWLEHDYISVVPQHVDYTSYADLSELKRFETP